MYDEHIKSRLIKVKASIDLKKNILTAKSSTENYFAVKMLNLCFQYKQTCHHCHDYANYVDECIALPGLAILQREPLANRPESE